MNSKILAALAALSAAAVIVAISWPDARALLGFSGGSCAQALAEVKGFQASKPTKKGLDVPFFVGTQGTEARLADYEGRGLVVNFWATWCPPCIKEMPSLLALKRAAPQGIEVLTISEDREGAAIAQPFLEKNGWTDLGVLVDQKGTLLRALGVKGLPTTVLFRPDGTEVARLVGITHWDSPEVGKVLDACIKPKGIEG